MNQQDSFKFDLTTPIEVYQNINGKNDIVKCQKLYLNAPTAQHRNNTLVLKKMFLQGMVAVANDIKTDNQPASSDLQEDSQLDKKAIKTILFISSGIDIVKFMDEFKKLLINKIAYTDENSKHSLTSVYFNKLSDEDIENLIANYIEVFFIVSWLRTLS